MTHCIFKLLPPTHIKFLRTLIQNIFIHAQEVQSHICLIHYLFFPFSCQYPSHFKLSVHLMAVSQMEEANP